MTQPQDMTFWTELVRQIPGILVSIGVCVTAVISAYVKLRAKVIEGNDTATATHLLINSRFDQWKKETMQAAVDAAESAAAIASAATQAAYKEGVAHAKAEAQLEAANIRQAQQQALTQQALTQQALTQQALDKPKGES